MDIFKFFGIGDSENVKKVDVEVLPPESSSSESPKTGKKVVIEGDYVAGQRNSGSGSSTHVENITVKGRIIKGDKVEGEQHTNFY